MYGSICIWHTLGDRIFRERERERLRERFIAIIIIISIIIIIIIIISSSSSSSNSIIIIIIIIIIIVNCRMSAKGELRGSLGGGFEHRSTWGFEHVKN